MSMFGNLKYVNAYFRDDARRSIITYWKENDSSESIIDIEISVDDQQYFNELLEHTSIDQIHENTWNYIKESEEAFKETVIEIAKERGWLVNMDDGGTSDFNKILIDIIFDEFNEEIHKEKLFFLKINIFEKDFVKECVDKDLKKKLRRASTPLEAIRVAIDIYDANQETSSPDTAD
tara:strand:+ start:4136 stop:4666 length:531 start_codon:yes stop_codon:yes gene_type:complete